MNTDPIPDPADRVTVGAPCPVCDEPADWTPLPAVLRWLVSCEHCGEHTTREHPADRTPAADTTGPPVPVEPPEGTDPRPGDVRVIPPPPVCRFDPTDPADLETFRGDLSARTGRAFRIPEPTEVPDDPTAADPDGTTWRTYPEDPCVRHTDRATGTAVDVSFPGDDTFRVIGWTASGTPAFRHWHRTGRFHGAGPVTLAWVLSRVIARDLTGDQETRTTTAAN